MLRMSISICLAAALFIGIFAGDAMEAAADEKPADQQADKERYREIREHKGHFKEEKRFILEHAKELGIETENKELGEILKEIRKAHIIRQAEALEIETENKDFQMLEKEVRETVINSQAKELGISTEGKDLQELAKEVKQAQIIKLADELNISTEGKSHRELTREVHEKLIHQSAEKLGIETKDKTPRELLAEIMGSEHRGKAKELKLFPFNSQFGQYFSVPKGKEQKAEE